MSSTADGFTGGGGMEEQFFLLSHQQHDGGGSLLFHVPQHSRREKLRFPPEHPPPPATSPLPLLLHHPNSGSHLDVTSANFHQIHQQQQQQQQQGFSLSLSPAAAGPLGPFTGYAAVLNRSRFLEPARLLLEEVCELGRGGAGVSGCGDLPEALVVGNYREMERAAGENQAGQQWRKTTLISMLDEIYRRYRLYYEQVQSVVSSFEKVAGLNAAAPYVSMALKSMSKHFTRIKDVICNHLNHLNKALGKEDVSEREFSGFGLTTGDVFLQKGKESGNFGKPPVWRPQRGLPERAVAVLRAWLFEHFLHPYPTDTDKQMLAKQTGLTRNQVANWFINARVRIWKPMVEEIHNLEIRQSHRTMVADDSQNHGKQASQPSSSAATSASNQPVQNSCMQRNPPHRSLIPAHYELPRIAHQIEEPYNFFFDNFSSHGHAVGVDIGASSGVSLTLGLHQNNGVCIPEPLPPMNVAHRFGLEECSNAYILGAFEGQDRLFGKDIGGHMLHDFVG